MSNFDTLRLNEDELTSPSSDEKMDTTESFRSQDTPNSLSSEFEDHESNVLRLQNPEVARLSESVKNNDTNSLTSKMSYLNVISPDRPRNLGISPPKFSSTLTITTDHPLMGLGSPDENFPDLIPKKQGKVDEEKDLSLSSIEDERHSETNGFYSPYINTSKNNLYFSENFVTADSQLLNTIDSIPPDVARVDKLERRKIIPKFTESSHVMSTPPRNLDSSAARDRGVCAITFANDRKTNQSTPKPCTQPVDITANDEYHTGVADWCESPSHLRAMPNFELPIEMSSSIGLHNDLDSPDVVSSSTQEDRSAYEALLDPYTGSVALRPTAHRSPAMQPSPATQRRKIQLPPEEDRCSLDSVSGCSIESEEEPPEPEPLHAQPLSDEEDTEDRRTKSTNTMSECSELIPEYSLADELSQERGWRLVSGQRACDMKVIEPFKRVLSHGGYSSSGEALIVFSACHLPDNRRTDYTYVMDNLFLYVMWTLERLVTERYVLVYLHGSAGRRRLPAWSWLHDCYKLVDRRLRKSLQHLYLVHPTFWLKSFVILTKPFVSSKFFRKLSYVRSLEELMQKVPVEPNAIPDQVKLYDATRR